MPQGDALAISGGALPGLEAAVDAGMVSGRKTQRKGKKEVGRRQGGIQLSQHSEKERI
jgi:hypothetical protein